LYSSARAVTAWAAAVRRRYPDVIGAVLPEILPMVGFDQRNPHHCYDVWEHTLHALDAAPPDPVLRWTVLFHDMGKPECFALDTQGVGHFMGHGVVSRRIADGVMDRLRFDNAAKERIGELVEWHDHRVETERGIRRMLNRFGERNFRYLLAIQRADNMGQAEEFRGRQKEIDRIEAMLDRELEKGSCFSLKQLAVNGNDLLGLGLSGPAVGRTLQGLLDQVMDGTLPNDRDALLTAVNRNFDLSDCVEYCIEAGRPDTIDREKLQVLLDHGADRISVNPQSLEPRVLSAIGRKHSPEDIEKAMELATSMGFPHVNMDLIAGLPADTPEGFRRTLDTCLTFGADNITVHTLSLKKGSRILLEGLPIPSAEDVAAMLDYADPALREKGFAPYYLYRQKYMSGSFENVGWCISGAEGLYNIYIMEELHSILSLGAGGSTKMVGGGLIRRAFNAKYPREYIDLAEKRSANLAAFADFYREPEEHT